MTTISTFSLDAYKKSILSILFFFFIATQLQLNAQSDVPLRRPISPNQPAWLIHIDTWNYADPQKIIDLIPMDIRPYVVMNISLSISHNVETSQFQVAEYGYEIAKSWLRVCAENQMWATVQLASGGFAQFSDSDLSVYEEFYREYPNLIGFNYAEQFWGFDDATDPLSPAWTDRMDHFANLLELSNEYGGYLVVSWCGNEWSQSINPIGMLKRNPAFAEASRKYTENYILFEKYTQQSYQSNMESLVLGAYLSGYSGNYGIRYDDTGWTNPEGEHEDFTMATAGAPHLEHAMLTGQTLMDGPELIWTQCFRETNRIATTNGYSTRNWETFPQFENVSIDLFRKVLDGTVRIPTREEVIERTKVAIINDVSSGTSDEVYSSPETLFEGLYRMDGDGNLRNNKSFFKKTGRYPTIPTVFDLDDAQAQSFDVQVKKSEYSSRWPSVSAKVTEFNQLFPEEYTGDLYAGRHENGWVVYNPFKTGQTASASIPFKYNTSESMELTFSQYTAGVVKETADQLEIYLNNYDNVLNPGLKTDIIKIYGSSVEPTFSFADRGDHAASVVSGDWSGGVFTLTIQHNGPLDITVECAGTATDRLTAYQEATLIEPIQPSVYTGPRQYEAEIFDYKNIARIVTGGQNEPIRNYTGQGYLEFGTNAAASVRKEVQALRKGTYELSIRYSAPLGIVSNVDVYVNGAIVGNPSFAKTPDASSWNTQTQLVELEEGSNIVVLQANNTGSASMYFDNIVLSSGSAADMYHFEDDVVSTVANTPAADFVLVRSGSAGVVSHTDTDNKTSNAIKTYSTGATNGTGVADLEIFNSAATDYHVVWKEYNTTSGAKKGILLRATGEAGASTYAEGLRQGYLFIGENNNDGTITLSTYKATESGLDALTSYTTEFTIATNAPTWFRAFAYGDQLMFECSHDSLTWVGAEATSFTDNSYLTGSTQLVWGLGSSNFDWVMDNITYATGNITISNLSIEDFEYVQGAGPSDAKEFTLSGRSITGSVLISAPAGFEISLDKDSGFQSELALEAEDGMVGTTLVYVRMEDGLSVQGHGGVLTISSGGFLTRQITLSGEVEPQPTTLVYDFSDDIATTSASTPPAIDVAIGEGNTATAGVVSFTDANSLTSNVFTPYAVGQRNATGVANLNAFSQVATDYSVTWKQYLGGSTSYKIGALLRGDTDQVGDASTGYVQGIMHGYLFIVYHTGSNSQFRIYHSNAGGLSALVNTGVGSLAPTVGQPVWYKASVSGSDRVVLTFEYSTDGGTTWQTGASITDNSPPFASGATQLVWGLAETAVDFYLDDIIFHGIDENSGSIPDVIHASVSALTGLDYNFGDGPSAHQSFTISASSLEDNVVVNAPASYELSLSPDEGYSSSVTLEQAEGTVNATTIYVRLKEGLTANAYDEKLIASSPGVLNEIVSLSGEVAPFSQVTVSSPTLIGFNYAADSGPSESQSFIVSGMFLQEDIVVEASDNYEISFDSGSGYSNTLSIEQTDGDVPNTTVYVRLKSGLDPDTYEGVVSLSSLGSELISVSLLGSVEIPLGIDPNTTSATVVSVHYYTLIGQKITDVENVRGIFVEKKFMSDGTITTSKILRIR